MADDTSALARDTGAISQLIYRFFNAMDRRDWQIVRACLCDEILVDYRDLRGDPPSRITADEYVRKRIEALTPLMTQHLSSNHVITVEGGRARCESQMVIYRRQGEQTFTTHCLYEHTLCRSAGGWQIDGIRQRVWWNSGDSSIHSGAQ